jgi:hypothetical protein
MFFRFLSTSLCLKEYINELSNLFGLKIRAVTPPLFEGDDYYYWKDKMELFLKS